MKKPRRKPAKISSRSMEKKTRGRHNAIRIPAREKRNARKRKTEEWSSEFFTTTNVEPHRTVQKVRPMSARKRFFDWTMEFMPAKSRSLSQEHVKFLRWNS